MSEGFLSRWSRRKEAVREGKPVAPEPLVPPPQPSPGGGGSQVQTPLPPQGERGGGASAEPPPTLDDVQSLTPEADFSRFVAPDVPPDVKNAALKKLFADPHFNAMDGLDVYIDDYSKPDPLPPAMLRQLAGARFLKLFDDEEAQQQQEQEQQGRVVADDPPAQTVAQSAQGAPAVPPPNHHAHDADLRLQQDHAPGRPGPGHGTE